MKNVFKEKWFWLLLPSIAFMIIGALIVKSNDQNDTLLTAASSISLLLGGSFLGLVFNYVSDLFKVEKNEWLPLAESSCKQILKMRMSIDRYLIKESGDNSFCSSIPDNSTDKALVKKHCEGVEMKLQDLNGDLGCMFSDWQNFINENCKDDQCSFIWHRVYSANGVDIDATQ